MHVQMQRGDAIDKDNRERETQTETDRWMERDRQKCVAGVVSWSLVPRVVGWHLDSSQRKVRQAMAGPIDVSARSHPRSAAPLALVAAAAHLSVSLARSLQPVPFPN